MIRQLRTDGTLTLALSAMALVGLSLFGAGSAGAQYDHRQTIEFTFGQRQPATSTSLQLAIDYVNPDDPSAKPRAVQTVVETLAAGARINTSVPPQCGASDSQLMASGASACPPGTRVGGGEVDLDTGFPGPQRILRFNVTQFNNQDELILLFESTSGLRSVSRAPIQDGRTIVAQAPPLPGGPPDGFTALKRVRLTLEAYATTERDQTRAYITTPRTCPTGVSSWTNQISFTYRDGVRQVAESRSPCRPGPRPRLTVRGVPRRCAAKAFRARIRVRYPAALRQVVVRADHRVLRKTTAKRLSVRVPVGKLTRGRHRLVVLARPEAGRLAVRRVLFRRCRAR